MKPRACPRCDSYKIEGQGCIYWALMGLAIMGIGCLGFVLLPLLLIIPVGLVILLAAPAFTGRKKCKGCGNVWR